MTGRAAGCWHRALAVSAVVVTVAIGGALDTPLKELVARARPLFDDPIATAPGYSFPSAARRLNSSNRKRLPSCSVGSRIGSIAVVRRFSARPAWAAW